MSGKRLLVSFLSGVLFAVGLGLSGMTQPEKVISFLDFTGAWDPSLAFVMGGAVAITFVLYRVAWQRKAPVFDIKFYLPTRHTLDRRLIAGSALFGIGWGLGGFCPGPALTSIASGALPVLVFVAFMSLGMFGVQLLEMSARPQSRSSQEQRSHS